MEKFTRIENEKKLREKTLKRHKNQKMKTQKKTYHK